MPNTTTPEALADFSAESFGEETLTRTVYWPPIEPGVVHPKVVLVCHEMPGMTPDFLTFVDHLRREGFYPVVPHLFGDVGRRLTAGYFVRSALKVCIAKEFNVLAKNHESPVAGFLRALTRRACERYGVDRIAAIGMCFTGNFALGLLIEPAVVRAVASQPSLPFFFTPGSTRALHLDPPTTDAIARRLADPSDDAHAMALRFSNDLLCPRARFDKLRETFGEDITLVEIDSSRGNPDGIGIRAHSVLTVDLVDKAGHPTFEARRNVVAFLASGLPPTPTR